MLLPLAFSYSATMRRKDSSSSRMKPWAHHTLALLAAALTTWGRANAPAAANPMDARSIERLLSLLISILPLIFFPRHACGFGTREGVQSVSWMESRTL